MRIVRIIARLNVGGPARHVVWLAKALRGEDSTLLIAGTVPEGEKDMGYFAEENGVSPHYIPEMSRELSAKDLISIIKLYRILRQQRPDVVHTHTAKAGTVGRIATMIYRWTTRGTGHVRTVHTFHGHVFRNYYGPFKTSIFILIERALAKLATDKIVVISHGQLEEIHGKFRIGRRSQFAVIPLGIDLKTFSGSGNNREGFRSEIEVKTTDIVVGFVGRLTEIKNISLLLEVAEIYKSRKGHDAAALKFIIIGDGHLRPALESEAAVRGITSLFHFLGNRDDPGTFYSGIDIVALTSLNEGTPLSLIEGMAAGCPVISTVVGGVGDLLGENMEDLDGFSVCERGIGVYENDPESFYEGLIYLAKNERLREKLSSAGRDYVHANYGVDRLVLDIQRLYRELSKGPPTSP